MLLKRESAANLEKQAALNQLRTRMFALCCNSEATRALNLPRSNELTLNVETS